MQVTKGFQSAQRRSRGTGRVIEYVLVALSFLVLTPGAYAELVCTDCHIPPHGTECDSLTVCTACHGNPPVAGTAGGPNGLVGFPEGTGAATAGAHAIHATSSGSNYACDTCHYGGMPTSPIAGNRKIQMGFSILGVAGGVYDGHALTSSYTYEGTYGTTITANGSKTCSNIYCHSNGTGGTANMSTGGQPLLNDPRSISANTSPAWDTANVPLACNSCHGNTVYTDYRKAAPIYNMDQPKANKHFTPNHEVFRCNVCHYSTTTDGVTIADTSKHVNGVYDVRPDPAAAYAGVPVSFTYVYDTGGGICNNVSCHPNGWSTSWGHGSAGFANVYAVPAANCYELSLSAAYFPQTAGVVPISYYWTFGDGTSEVEGSAAMLHTYPGPGPYTVTVRGRDSNYHTYTGHTQAWPEQTDTPPVVNETVSVNRYTVTLTDLSTDPDYNTCDHHGNGQIKVTWGSTGNVDVVPNVPLSTNPTNYVITRTFSSPASMKIVHIVTDNAGASAGKVVNSISVPGPISISGQVTYSNGTPFAGVKINLKTTGGTTITSSYTDANGGYGLSRAWVHDCYLVQPYKSGFTFTPSTLTVCASTSDANLQAN